MTPRPPHRPSGPAPYTECPVLRPSGFPAYTARARDLLAGTIAALGTGPVGRELAEAVRARYPRHAAQAAAGARLLGVDAADLMLATLSYDLFLALYGCSTAALATADGPVLVRNL